MSRKIDMTDNEIPSYTLGKVWKCGIQILPKHLQGYPIDIKKKYEIWYDEDGLIEDIKEGAGFREFNHTQ